MTTAAAVEPPPAQEDALIAWFRGEFAAANAIIDALCVHLVEITGGGTTGSQPSEYEEVFKAIYWRRMNWMQVLQMQKYFSIAEVVDELRHVTAEKRRAHEEVEVSEKKEKVEPLECDNDESMEERGGPDKIKALDGSSGRGRGSGSSSPSSHEDHSSVENSLICSDAHEDCVARRERFEKGKRFTAREPVKGHMVNVVKGLKLYEDIFTDLELSRLSEFINELRLAGRNGELSGDTFIFFNKQLKGNKREIIRLGVPLFQPTTDESTSNIEPIPSILQDVIDHLVQWRLIPESRRPDSCIINFFDEDEHSQPYLKPPHLENPISTLLLNDTSMAFGRVLVSDTNGDFKGSLNLQLKEGSFLVMRGNSADMARHVICPSPNTRVSITFARVRHSSNQVEQTPTMAIWEPSGALGCGVHGMVPAWGMAVQAPIFMVAQPRPVVLHPTTNTKRMTRSGGSGGTGVFLPWNAGSKKYIKHLPPRIQKRRLPSLPPLIEMQVEKASQIPCFAA